MGMKKQLVNIKKVKYLNENISSTIVNSGKQLSDRLMTQQLPQVLISKQIEDYSPLNDMERHRLRELFDSTQVFAYLFSRNHKHIVHIPDGSVHQRMDQVYGRRGDRNIQHVITMCRSLSTFNYLIQSDQLAIVKYGHSDLLNLRFSYNYHMNAECCEIAVDKNTVLLFHYNLMKPNSESVYTARINYHHYFNQIWDQDYIILYLLMAITIFNPSRPHITHQSVIRCERQLYIHLLHRYLKLKYRRETHTMIAQYMTALSLLKQMNDIFIEYSHQLYDKYYGPLMREIRDFSLK
ncbi:oxysterols receptor LXR-alpha-like [Oppia nitens]|uniref:oxysterols receptor LXR-alpha-like n=1 Tax=Oppia nitens TaxID=1686743 RepID=UPI0023DB3139|nr:oxysterols receptor LXR-alpha-like [Oppia nitens]